MAKRKAGKENKVVFALIIFVIVTISVIQR